MPKPRATNPLRIHLHLETSDARPPLARWLPTQLKKLAALAGVRSGSLSIVVVNDRRMAAIHLQYSKIPGTTDVLTFDLLDDLREGPGDAGKPPAKHHVEGDIIVCLGVARREAQARGRDARLEVLLYALHGLLHLLDHDDHTDSGYRKMHHREDELLSQAGLGALFTVTPATTRESDKPSRRGRSKPR